MPSFSGLAMGIMADYPDFKAAAHGLSVFMDSLTRVRGPGWGGEQGSNYVGGMQTCGKRGKSPLSYFLSPQINGKQQNSTLVPKVSVAQWFSNRGHTSLRGHSAMSGDILGCDILGRWCCWHLADVGQDTMHRTAPLNKQ